MHRLQKNLPDGWQLAPPEPSGVLSDIARVISGPFTVHIRWPRPEDANPEGPDKIRVLAYSVSPSPEDWILICTNGEGNPIPPPAIIRDWAAAEVLHLYKEFKSL